MKKSEDYKNILSDIIKEHMVLFDPTIALSVAKSIAALTTAEDGTVYEIKGNPKDVFTEVKEQYIEFGGDISRDTIESVVKAYANKLSSREN